MQLLGAPEPRPIPAKAAPVARPRRGPRSARNLGEWNELRPQLRDLIRRRQATRDEVAEAIGLRPTTLQRVLRKGQKPSHADIAKAAALLATRQENPATAEAPSATAASPGPPAKRLNATDRDRLSGYLAHAPARQIRDELHISAELVHQAANGAVVPLEVIGRITEFLAAPG